MEGLNGLDIRVGAEVDTEEEEEEDDGGQQEPPTVIDDAPENSCDDNNEVGMDATPSINPEANSLEQWKAILELSVSESVGRVTRDSLVIDPFIADTANALGIPDDGRVVKDKKSRLVFHIRAYYFEEWLKRYQTHISTSFNQHEKPRAYSTNVSKDSTQAKKDRAGQVITRYDCHCKGKKFVRKGNIPGGKSGKPRMKATSFRCDCKSYFNAIYCPAKPQDGKPETTYRIEYFYEHNHEIGDKGGVGKLHKSKAFKERIRAMLLRGMSIQAIMDQLTVDHARFTRLMDNGEIQRLCRDDFITYDDVYNILYAITSKEMRKDNDQLISARLWMEELRNQGYFTYYDQEHGIYHGFSSPWQLQELRKWGDVFCFDGTHHACGYVLFDEINF